MFQNKSNQLFLHYFKYFRISFVTYHNQLYFFFSIFYYLIQPNLFYIIKTIFNLQVEY